MEITLRSDGTVTGVDLNSEHCRNSDVHKLFCSVIAVVDVYGQANIIIDNHEPVKYVLTKK